MSRTLKEKWSLTRQRMENILDKENTSKGLETRQFRIFLGERQVVISVLLTAHKFTQQIFINYSPWAKLAV